MFGYTQTELAQTLLVSFPTLNSWWHGKSKPRSKKLALIEELYLEVTGQKIIPVGQLSVLKQALQKQSERYKSVVDDILTNPDIRDEFVLKLTYHSNHIEGSTLTLPETAAILFDNVALPNKSLTEHLEAKNHQTALLYLFEQIHAKQPVNEALALKLHGILMNGVMPNAGQYRTHGVRIAGVNLPTANFQTVPKLMTEVMAGISPKDKDVVASSAYVHSTFERIRPFSDGNGRVGRLLMCAMLLRVDFAPAVIVQEKKQLYYTYLYKAQTKDDHSQLEAFICQAVAEGFKILERAD
jgi:Fic family protein